MLIFLYYGGDILFYVIFIKYYTYIQEKIIIIAIYDNSPSNLFNVSTQ